MLVLAIALTVCAFQTAFACSCLPQSDQDKFCKSSYGFMGTVTKELPPRDQYSRTFKVKVDNLMIKKPADGASFEEVTVSTASQGPACGVEFTVGQHVALAGNVGIDGTMNVGLCDFNKKFTTENRAQLRDQRTVLEGYRRTCKFRQ